MQNVVEEPNSLQFIETCSRLMSLSKLACKVGFVCGCGGEDEGEVASLKA